MLYGVNQWSCLKSSVAINWITSQSCYIRNLTTYYMAYRIIFLFFLTACASAADEEEGDAIVEDDIGKSRDGSKTDDEVVAR